jgi:hypothetical protein
MTRFMLGLAAALMLAAPAFADDYIAMCKVGQPGDPNADKICKCASEKVKPEDRASAIAGMQAVNDAMSQSKQPDTSDPKLTKGIGAAMEALAACM